MTCGWFGGGTASLDDLIGCWSRSSGRDLGGWAQEWLRTEGASTLRVSMTLRASVAAASLAGVSAAGAAPGAPAAAGNGHSPRQRALAAGFAASASSDEQLEVVRSWRGETSLTICQPWVVSFAFGLLHGFGFASGLIALGLPRADIPLALLMFNVGVEVGQLLFVMLILLLERAFRVLEIRWPRLVEALPAYTLGSLGAYWTIQRLVVLFGGAR